jgi:hypothetical protein
MGKKPDIQYVTQFYIHGSEAPALQPQPQRQRRSQRTTPAVAAPVRKIRIAVDPVAVCGIVVAVVMVILMAVGVMQYMDTCRRYETMHDQVIDLQNQNITLERDFRGGYDPEDIREKALAIGMVSIDQVEVIKITEYVPVEEVESTLWEEISWFLKGLFA